MKTLAGFLLTVFGKFFEFLKASGLGNYAFGVALIAAFVAMLGTFYAVMKGIVLGLTYQVTNTVMLQAFWAIWPSNAEVCISAYWTAQITAFIYREHKENMRAISYVR